MAGIYVHIPFCKSRCIYCSFYSSVLLGERERYVEALTKEADMRKDELKDPVNTIYIGGGTPSLLSARQLETILEHLYNEVHGRPREITMECNPDDVDEEKAAAWRSLGVNRISMGVQTFSDARLRWMRRRHSAEQAVLAFDILRRAGFTNINIDLIYGLPGETLSEWQQDIDRAIELAPEHISSYCLGIEEGTPLYQTVATDEEQQREMFFFMRHALISAGYEHYEISNFARRGYRSRHNSGYWQRKDCLGLGAAAHSLIKERRRWNPPSVHEYMDLIKKGEKAYREEIIDETERYNETVMLSLRTPEGIDLGKLRPSDRRYLCEAAKAFAHKGDLVIEGSHVRLTEQSLFIGDYITREMMR